MGLYTLFMYTTLTFLQLHGRSNTSRKICDCSLLLRNSHTVVSGNNSSNVPLSCNLHFVLTLTRMFLFLLTFSDFSQSETFMGSGYNLYILY